MHKFIKSYGLFYTLLFAVFVVFFTQIHPLVPFDTDDWINMGMARPGYPTIDRHVYNPAKILPEVLQPATAMVAAYLIAPFTGDYIGALILANALVVSAFIIVFLFFVQRLLEARFQTGRFCGFAIVLLFTLFHFQIFRIEEWDNDYLWYATDPTCFFHYVLPDLLCASLVLWLMHHDIRKVKSNLKISILLFTTYLALCSNLYASVILIAYIGAVLVFRLCQSDFHQKSWLMVYVKCNMPFLITILFWLIIQWCEANGRRASHTSSSNAFLSDIWLTTKMLLHIRCNLKFVVTTFFILLGAKIHHYRHFHHKLFWIGHTGARLALALVFSCLYLVLLSAKVGPSYILRPGVILAFVIFYLILVVLSLAYLCTHTPWIKAVLPLFICFVFFDCNTRERTFKDVHHETGMDIQTCISVNHDIVHQVQLADARGKQEIYVDVPRFSEGGNWPLSLDCSLYFGRTLYKHNMTRQLVETYFNPIEQ